MKNKILKNIKYTFFGLAGIMMFAGIFLFSACAPKKNYGQFIQDEIVLSIGQQIDMASLYASGNAEVYFTSENEEFLSGSDGVFKAIKPGEVVVYSLSSGKRIDFLKVRIKDSYSAPSNITISDDGLISWNDVSLVVDGVQVLPRYQIKITGGELNEEIIDCDTTSYQLKQKGEYKVSVRAVENEKVDASQWSEEAALQYMVMEKVKDIVFESLPDPLLSNGILSWTAVQGASYNVVINGVLFETNTNSLEINLSSHNNPTVEGYIEAVDLTGEKASSKSEIFKIEKLSAPVIEYNNGVLTWGAVYGAEKYYIRAENKTTSHVSVFETTELSTSLQGLEEGKYNVYVQAIAGKEKCNSSVSKFDSLIYKLGTCDISFERTGSLIEVKLTTNSKELTNLKLYLNESSYSMTALEEEEGVYVASNIFDLPKAGIYKFSAQVVPTISEGKVEQVEGLSSVIKSNLTEELVFYKLDNAKNLTHEIDGEGNSLLSFNQIENAEIFKAFVNGVEVDIKGVDFGEETTLNLGILDRTLLGLEDGLEFEIIVEANREDSETTILSTTSKNLSILEAPASSLLNGADLGGNIYSWEEVESAGYRYDLFKTSDSNFDISAVDPVQYIVESESSLPLEEGFYVIHIYSTAKDQNEHLDSRNYLSDSFIVSKNQQKPTISGFEFDETLVGSSYSGYVLKFTVPQLEEDENYARDYEIYVKDGDEMLLLSRAEAKENKEYVYNFKSKYNFLSGQKEIFVRMVCKDAELAKVYKPSEYAHIVIEKHEKPTQNDVNITQQILSISKKGNSEKAVITQEGSAFMDGEDFAQQVDLSSQVGTFRFNVFYQGYERINNEGGLEEVYLQSEEYQLDFVRDPAPTELYYEDRVISFNHLGKAETFNLELTVKTQNDSEGKTWKCVITDKNFDLDTLQSYFIQDVEFASYYEQKTALIIKISAEINQFIDGVYYLPSKNPTENNGVIQLEVEKLERVSDLSFDKESNCIVWSSLNPSDTSYDIYFDNTKKATVSVADSNIGEVCYYSYSLNWLSTDVEQGYSFHIVANRKNYIDSNNSNKVVVTKLSPIKSVKISTNLEREKVYASWSISDVQLNQASKILLNGEEKMLDAKALLLESETEEIKLQLIAREAYVSSGVTYAFMDSDEAIFTITKAKPNSYTANLRTEDFKVQWNSYNDENGSFSGVIEPSGASYSSLVKYRVYVYANVSGQQVVYYKDLNDVSSLKLDDQLFKNLSASTYQLNVFAYLSEYTISSDGHGVYAFEKLSEDNIEVRKLNSVTNLNYSYVDESSSTTIAEEQERSVKISWDFEDNSTAETNFKVQLVKADGTEDYTTTNKYYETSISEDVKQIIVTATSSKDISSEETICDVTRLEKPIYSISNLGVLSISNHLPTNKYIVEVNGTTTYVDVDQEIDLFEYFKTVTPEYDQVSQTTEITVRIMAVGQGKNLSSSIEESSYQGLGVGHVFTKADKVYFYNLSASAVNVVYQQDEEQKTIRLTEKKKLYAIDIDIHSAKGDQIFYTEVPSNFEYNQDNIREISGFEFEIPEGISQLKFTYSFEREGFVSSYYDQTFTTRTEYNIESLSDINEVFFNIDESTQKEGFWLGSVDEAESLYIKITYTSGNQELTFAEIDFKGNYFTIDTLEKVLVNKTLPARTYHFEVWKTKRFESNALGYSKGYSFDYIKQSNSVNNVRVGQSGYIEWNDSKTSHYDIRFEGGHYLSDVKYFDMRLANTDKFSIVILGDIPHGTKLDNSSAQSSLDTNNVFTGESNALTYELSQLLQGSFYTPDFTVLQTTEDADIIISTESNENYNVYVEYNKKLYKVPSTKTDDAGQYLVKVRLIDIIDTIGEDFTEEIDSVKISLVIDGMLKSNSIQSPISLIKNTQTVNAEIKQLKSGDMINEYISYSSALAQDCSRVYVKITDARFATIKEAIVAVEDGYWIVCDNSIKTGFYSMLPEDLIFASSEEVKVIDIGTIFSEIEIVPGETYKVSVAPIHSQAGVVSQLEWLGSLAYKKLHGAEEIKVTTYGEKVYWEDEDPDERMEKYLVNTKAGELDFNSYFDKTEKQISFEEFNDSKAYEVYVYAVSSAAGALASNPISLENVIKNKTIKASNIVLENGEISLNWEDGQLTVDEEAGLNSADGEVETNQINKIFEEGNFLKILKMIEHEAYSLKDYTASQLVEKLLTTTYRIPFSFKLDTVETEVFQLKFVVENDREYLVNVGSNQLLKPISSEYIEILERISQSIPSSFNGYVAFKTAIAKLKATNSFKGIANIYNLFDDLGQGTAEKITADNYSLYIRQLGKDSRLGLKSEETKAFDEIEVLQAPRMQVVKTAITNDEGEILTSKYSLKFKPITDKSGNSINDYILIFGEDADLTYPITKIGSTWTMIINENAVTLSTDGLGLVVIPLNSVKDQVGIEEHINFITDYEYETSVMALGEGTKLNSKTDLITIAFLSGINPEMVNGELCWQTRNVASKSFKTNVIYQKTGALSYKATPVSGSGGSKTYYYPDGEGKYNFIALLTQGYVGQFSAYVDSKIKVIENPAQLYSPSLSTYDGRIKIEDNPQNNFSQDDGYSRIYRISNDRSTAYLLTNEMPSSALYQAGINAYTGEYGTYKATESQATEFKVANAGSSGAFVSGGEINNAKFGKAEVIKLESNSKVLFRSQPAIIQGQMLKTTTLFVNDDGNYEWAPINKSNVGGLDISNDSNKKVIYEVDVSVYRKTNTSSGVNYVIVEDLSQTLYTEKTVLRTEDLKYEEDGFDYYYCICVSAGVYSSNGYGEYITTIEDADYYLISNEKYQDSTINVLRGEDSLSTSMMERLESPTGILVSDGKIKFNYPKTISNVAFKVYYSKFNDFKLATQLEGTATRKDSEVYFETTEELETNVGYYFWVKVLDIDKERVSSVTVKADSKFYKLPTVSDQDVTITDITDFEGVKFKIDLSSYLAKLNSLDGTKDYFTLDVRLNSTTKFELSTDDLSFTVAIGQGEADQEERIFYLSSGRELSMKVTPKAYNSNKVLNGSVSEAFIYKQLAWSEEDTIAWNETNKEFEWTYGKQTTFKIPAGTEAISVSTGQPVTFEEDKEGVVKSFSLNKATVVCDDGMYTVEYEGLESSVSYRDTTGLRFIVEITTSKVVRETQTKKEVEYTTQTYTDIDVLKFAPTLLGDIQSISIQVKGGKNDFISLKKTVHFETPISFNIFESGSGISTDPYIIKSADQFNNINLRAIKPEYMKNYTQSVLKVTTNKDTGATSRNQGAIEQKNTDGSFYFKQQCDITINMNSQAIISAFGGVYDGAGYKLEITGSATRQTQLSVYDGADTREFKNGIALFDKILPEAKVANLTLSVGITYQSQENALMAGLVLENNGLVENISISLFDIALSGAVPENQILAIAPIAAINNGKIFNCANSAEVTVSNNFTGQTGASIWVGGAVVYNTGTIQKVSNYAGVTLNVSDQNVNSYVAGIVVFNNKGTIDLCSNSANITSNNESGNARTAGIVCYTNEGEIKYSFNMGNIVGGGKTGGIAYYLNKTKLSNVLAYGKVNRRINNVFFADATLGLNENCFTYSNYSNDFGMSGLVNRNTDFEIIHDELKFKIVVDYIDSSSYTASIVDI